MTSSDPRARDRRLAGRATVALVLLIAGLTLYPIQTPGSVPGTDKLHHLVAFAALALPLSWAWPRHALLVIVAAALYGGVIELVQPHVGRFGELSDWYADSIGAALGGALGAMLGAWRGRRLTREA
ncbi:VanZ family protein [Roseovarius spongiae]|uniref:VanZ family protein n=1 Tax=Roseovarius spongiae TaxID=2320272 RepID=A0A3A8BAM8_9RHOB|nr:VanZ family protein [Roseovarius spongiae]RKF16254.1 VanZ family protein [Roseovarius spongiae]